MKEQKIFNIYSSRITSPTKERLRYHSKDIYTPWTSDMKCVYVCVCKKVWGGGVGE